MKAKRPVRLTEKIAKLKLRRLKKKFIPQKVKKHSVRKNKNMFTPKDVKNFVNNDDNDDTWRSIPSQSQVSPSVREDPDLQRSHFMRDTTEWNNYEQQMQETVGTNSEEETVEKMDDDWILKIAPKEQKNMNSPFVVEMLPKDFTWLNLKPETLQRAQTIKFNEDTFCTNMFEPSCNEENASVIVAPCINPKDSIDSQVEQRRRRAPSASSSVNENNEGKIGGNKSDIGIDNINSPSSSSTREQIVQSSPAERNNCAKKHRHKLCPKNDRRRSHTRVRKEPEIFCIRNIVIVIMESQSSLCFTGKLSVKVLYGAVNTYGSLLDASNDAAEVYSPRGYSSVVVEATGDASLHDNVENVWTSLSAEGITRDSESELQIEIDKVQPEMAVIVLQNIENHLTLFLKTYYPFKLFPNIRDPNYYSWRNPKRAEAVLQAKLNLSQYDDLACRRLIIEPLIAADLTETMLSHWRADEWSCTLIAGGKNVGKSTSARCLINNLLRTSKKVVLVDVDPGQAEFTPAGCISYSLIEEPLMGPNFTHLRTPVYQLFIDEINVSQCVTRYLNGIKMLLEKLKACPVLSRLPIVVNTMGFTQSIGWDLLIWTIKLIRPSHILQIMSTQKNRNYSNYLSKEIINKQERAWTFCDETFADWNRPCEHYLWVMHSQVERYKGRANEWNMEPYQQRELVLMSYLSGITRTDDVDDDDLSQYNARLPLSINEAVPYTAPFSSLCIIPQRLFGIPTSHALSVINGNIVALCGVDLTEEFMQEVSEGTSSLRVLTQRSPLCTCYGFGIIRGIDMKRQEVFINTPLPISVMQHVNCLAGCIPIPPALLQLNQSAPYVGGNAMLPTSRESRRGYFRMKYQKKPDGS